MGLRKDTKPTLGGVMFIKDGVKYDYCFTQSIECLCDLCDQVSVVGIESEDATIEVLGALSQKYSNLFVTVLEVSEWIKQKGKQKLAYFQNLALSFLDTEYYYLQQADEITHEDSFDHIREAMERDNEAFLVSRINLWGDCGHYINVPPSRQPCSINVVRLAKTNYKSFGDGESIACPFLNIDFVDKINMVHYGFVRKKEIMKAKVINMQRNIFEIDYDPKLDKSEVFNNELWFKESELSKITFRHPKWIEEWTKSRP